MALILSDRVKETTTTTGTGTYTLGGAVVGFESFASIGNSNTTYYCCTDGTDFEVGIGTYTSSGTTLARTTILQSSNSDSAVNWSAGTKEIFCTLPAEKAVVEDASNNINGTFVGDITGNVTGNASGTAATVTGAAQTNITSVGTLTGLTTSGTINLSQTSGVAIKTTGNLSTADLTLLRASASTDGEFGFDIKYVGSRTGNDNSYSLFMHNQTGTDVEAMTVLQDGKVGINNTSPSAPLDVSGDAEITGTLTAGEVSATTLDIGGTNITATATEINKLDGVNTLVSSSGAINTDASAEIGRVHVGHVGWDDFAGFSHVDQNTQTTYSLLQASSGKTYLNSASGQTTALRINNSTVVDIASDGATVTGKLDAGILEGKGGVTYDPPGSSGTDTATDVAVAVHSGDRIVLGENGFIRTIVDATWGSALQIGQSGTGAFTGTEIYGGNDGVTLKHSTNTKLETTATGATVTGELKTTTLEIGGTDVTATATELNYVDVTTLGTVEASKAVTADSGADVTFPSGSQIITTSDGSNAVISVRGGGPNFIEFLDNTSTTDGVKLAYRTTPHDLRIERTVNSNIIAEFGGDDGHAALYHDNSIKLETTANGATVTGTLVADGVTLGDSEEVQFGAGTDLRIYHNGSHSFIREQGTGDLKIQSTNLSIELGNGTLLLDTNDSTNAVQLYDNGELRLRTTDTGIDVLCEDSDSGSDNTANIRIIAEGTNEILTLRSNDGVGSYIIRNGSSHGDHLFQSFDGSSTTNLFRLTTTGHTFEQDVTVNGDLTTDEVFVGDTTDHKIGKVNHTYGDGIGLTTDDGTVTIGQANSSYTHYFNSNNVPHWFNKQVIADGGFSVWGTNDNLTLKAGGVIFEGATADSHETTLNVVDPTADRAINLPDAAGTVALKSEYFQAYRSSDSAALTSSFVIIDFDTITLNSNGSVFSESGGEVTINKTGIFRFHTDVTVRTDSGSSRSDAEIEIQKKPSGGSYSSVTGTTAVTYNRTNNLGDQTSSIDFLISVTSGDTYKVMVKRQGGSGDLEVQGNGTRFNIQEVN